MNDIVHAFVVLAITLASTIYASVTHDRSDNIWIVYGSGIAYAAGRSGSAAVTRMVRRDDPPDISNSPNI